MSTGIKEGVAAGGIYWFLGITFVFSWTLVIGMSRMGIEYGSPASMVMVIGYMFIPGLSAFIVRCFIAREGFGDAGLRIGVRKYYLVAWFLWPVLGMGALALTIFSGHAQWHISPLTGFGLPFSPSVDLAIVIMFSLLFAPWFNAIAGFCEEFGWRGYLQVKLSSSGRLRSYVITGVIWGVWHAPIILQGHNYPDHPQLGVLAMIVFCILLGIILGWLRDASGSVFVAALAHGSLNATASLPYMLSRDFTSTLIGPGIWGAAGWLVLGFVILWLWRRRAFNITAGNSFCQEMKGGWGFIERDR